MAFGADIYVPTNCNTSFRLAETAAKIALNNFDWHHTTLIFFNTTLMCGIDAILKEYPKNVEIGYEVFAPRNPELITQYILLVPNTMNMEHMLTWMDTKFFNNIGKYIIICESEIDENCDEEQAMQILWDHRIVNVVFLRSKNKKAMGYTYYFKGGICRNGPAVELKTLESCALNFITSCKFMYPAKLRNFYQCPISVSAFRQKPYMYIDNDLTPSGADGDLLLLLLYGLNATLRLVIPQHGFAWGSLEQNGTWSGSLGDVYYDRANFSMTSAAITYTRYSHFHLSSDYNFIQMTWFTGCANLKPSYLKLLSPFKIMTHFAVILTFLVVVATAIVVKSKLLISFIPDLKPIKIQRSIVFYSWMICMGQPYHKLLAQRSYLFIIILWIWYCFLIRTFYQTCLIGALKNHLYNKEFQKIEDVMQANHGIGGTLALRDYYIDYPLVYNKWQVRNPLNIPSMLANISEGMKFALATNLVITQAIVKDNNKIQVHNLPQVIVTSPVVLFHKKFSPLVSLVNRILSRIKTAGISSMLLKKYVAQLENTKIKKHNEAINTGHFTGCYVILAIGWFMSTMSFVLELLYEKIYRLDFIK